MADENSSETNIRVQAQEFVRRLQSKYNDAKLSDDGSSIELTMPQIHENGPDGVRAILEKSIPEAAFDLLEEMPPLFNPLAGFNRIGFIKPKKHSVNVQAIIDAPGIDEKNVSETCWLVYCQNRSRSAEAHL